MTTITTTQISINEWTDRKGNTRRYINGWLEALYGMEVEYYKTGNIGVANRKYLPEPPWGIEPQTYALRERRICGMVEQGRHDHPSKTGIADRAQPL